MTELPETVSLEEGRASARLSVSLSAHEGRPDPWLAIVIPARYGGCYEGAPFVAFYVDPDFGQIPDDAIGPDWAARNWWDSDEATRVGRGVTPNAALVDLAARHPDDRELREAVEGMTS